jgi:BirA family biotin operon repressor/biotin-[acetyl-CoA-carboxylase] ligase
VPNPNAPLDIARIRGGVAGTRFADVRYVAETASTNADAQELLGEPTSRGATIVAEHQTAGVGRKGRAWLAPAGSALLFTSLFPEPVPTAALWAVPFWIALGVAAGVEAACGATLDLVWPNDLHAHGRKCGGILSVARVIGELADVGCGVGLNVLRPAADAELAALNPPPIFLNDLVSTPAREAVLVAILRAFDDAFGGLTNPESIARRWERRAGLAGTPYRYRRDADGIERDGIAQRLGPQGTLVVRGASGDEIIDMADVRVIRQA